MLAPWERAVASGGPIHTAAIINPRYNFTPFSYQVYDRPCGAEDVVSTTSP